MPRNRLLKPRQPAAPRAAHADSRDRSPAAAADVGAGLDARATTLKPGAASRRVAAAAAAAPPTAAAAAAAAAASSAASSSSPAFASSSSSPASATSSSASAASSSPASSRSMHALARTATIRTVPSLDGSDSGPESHRRSPLASSVNSTASSTASTASAMSASAAAALQDRSPPSVRLKGDDAAAASAAATAAAASAASASSASASSARWGARAVRAAEPSDAAVAAAALSPPPPHHHHHHHHHQQPQPPADAAAADADASGQWDSTIGKAGLGKTGRVINKLVSDNDALKRDIQIERLRADEAKQAARLVEDKMERIISDYEGRLLEASVTKTLLTRKERQVETLTATVEAEKKKAAAALESERGWRHELEKVRGDSAAQIDEATAYAQLMEGRYNAISSHWRDQGDEVRRALARMRGDIGAIVDERRSDDDKIQTLRDVCDQQDGNIRRLRRDKEELARLFDAYRRTQEEDLREIRASAARREEEQEALLEESRRALAKLKWALNVRQNVRDAQ